MLAARVLEQEHIIYPKALAWLATGDIAVKDERVIYSGSATPTSYNNIV